MSITNAAQKFARQPGCPIRRPKQITPEAWGTFKRLMMGRTIRGEAFTLGLHVRAIGRRQHTVLATLSGQAARRRASICRKTPDGEVCRQATAVYAITLDTAEA